MPLNPDAVGTVGPPVERTWNSKDALLYAVGVGAGHPDPSQELEFTTENSHEITQQVLPTFAVIIGSAGREGAVSPGTYNSMFLVHGEQGVTLHRPIAAEGRMMVTNKLVAIYDKGSAAVVVTENDAVDADTGEPLMSTRMSTFIRGEGGFGGDRGPSGARNVPPDRSPDEVVKYQVKPDQALIYRLSGDRNPLHADPWFAKGAGFERPILHGLCTYGFTGRALLHALCGSDPARFTSMDGRFSKPVYPGDELTVSMWVDGSEGIFRTTVGDTTVIDSGLCSFKP